MLEHARSHLLGSMLIGIRSHPMGEGFVHGFQEYLPAWLQLPQRFFIHLSLQHCRTCCFADDPSCALPAFVPRPTGLIWMGRSLRPDIHRRNQLTDLLFDAARFNLIDEWQYSLHQFEHPVYGQERSWAPVALGPGRFVGRTWRNFQLVFLSFRFLHIATMLVFVNILITPSSFMKSLHFQMYSWDPDYPHARQKWIDLEDEKAWEEGKIGINSLEQLTWKQGLIFCLYRMDDVMTFARPTWQGNLWPRNGSTNLCSGICAKRKETFIGPAPPVEKIPVGDVIHPETLWACTTCRA